MYRHQILVSFVLLITLSLALCNEDHRILLCQQACIKVSQGNPKMSKAEIDELIEMASRNAQKCSNKCVDLFVDGDKMDSILEKLRRIPLKELFGQ